MTKTLFLPAVLLHPAALEILGTVVEERVLSTPFGDVGPIALRRRDNDTGVWIQPYSGLPSRLDPHATIHAAQTLAVDRIVAWDAVLSLHSALTVGSHAVVADFVDLNDRNAVLQTATVAAPTRTDVTPEAVTFCASSRHAIQGHLPRCPAVVYLGAAGNRRETAAEARIFRQWGIDVVGYNMLPEVILARHAGLCFTGLVSVNRHAVDPTRAHAGVPDSLADSIAETLAAIPSILDSVAAVSCGCRRQNTG